MLRNETKVLLIPKSPKKLRASWLMVCFKNYFENLVFFDRKTLTIIVLSAVYINQNLFFFLPPFHYLE